VTAAEGRWNGGDSWWTTPHADRFDGPGRWLLEVVSTEVPAGTSLDRWVADHRQLRPELQAGSNGRYCQFPHAALGTWLDDWRDWEFAGRPARLRAACGFLDAVVTVEDRVYVFALTSNLAGRMSTGDSMPGPSLEALGETVRFGVGLGD
jgi:hypothetical protein